MSLRDGADWRAWILLIFTLVAGGVGAGLGLFFRAEAYADQRVEWVRRELCENVAEMRQDLRLIRADLRLLADRERNLGER